MRAPWYVCATRAHARFPAEVLRTLFDYVPETGEVILLVPQLGRRFTVNNEGYAGFWIDGAYLLSHRIAWCLTTGAWPEGMLDHIDRDRSNNRWTNLRSCSRSLNAQNVAKPPRTSSTGLLGAQIDARSIRAGRRKPYRSSIVDATGKRHSLGTFETAEAAHAAYLRAKAIHHPEVSL